MVSGPANLRRVHLALSLRVTVAAILALVAAQFFGLPLPLWVVLTAVIVTQMSVGRSLKATGDYLLGTVGGSIYGGAVAILIPHESELALLAVLVIALAPLALLAAVRPNMNVVPITAIIVLLLPGMTHTSPLEFGDLSRARGRVGRGRRPAGVVHRAAVERASPDAPGGGPHPRPDGARARGADGRPAPRARRRRAASPAGRHRPGPRRSRHDRRRGRARAPRRGCRPKPIPARCAAPCCACATIW